MSQTSIEIPFDLTEIVNNLVTEDDEPVDNILSEKQQRLLTETLYSSWTPPADETLPDEVRSFWASANVGVFASVNQPPLVPDVFLSLDVSVPDNLFEKKGRSYLAWEHGKLPEVVVGIVSNQEGGELSYKLREYARMGVQYYVVYDPMQLLSQDVLRVYEPGLGRRYRLRRDYALPDVGLHLTLWAGSFENKDGQWVRWCHTDGTLLPTPDEKAARSQAEAARAREVAALATERAEKLAAKLRELGVDPEQV